MTIEWEEIKHKDRSAGYTYRAKVFGGWLVKVVDDVCTLTQDGYSFSNQQNWEWRSSICFIPDPLHSWTGEHI